MARETNNLFSCCPKCGSPSFLTGDKGRSFRCEECLFHYYINNSAAVACLIINASGELLLTRRAFEPNKGMLDLPGGFVEPMESAEEAVIREIMEELNLRVTKMSYLVSYPNLYPYSNFEVPTVDLAYLCDVEKLDCLRPDDDVASIEFIKPDKIPLNVLCSNSMRQIVQFYLKSGGVN
ncbi:MAG: NUDIX domain-containing protein [Prolixibacteraceae bacterium]|nr:NUDIX domain-containing protein [Prolixibacteraceae bacterium]